MCYFLQENVVTMCLIFTDFLILRKHFMHFDIKSIFRTRNSFKICLLYKIKYLLQNETLQTLDVEIYDCICKIKFYGYCITGKGTYGKSNGVSPYILSIAECDTCLISTFSFLKKSVDVLHPLHSNKIVFHRKFNFFFLLLVSNFYWFL